MNPNNISPLTPPALKNHDTHIKWSGLYGCSRGLAIIELAKKQQRPLLIITTDVHASNKLSRELNFFNDNTTPINITSFPDLETLPYDHFSPYEDIISQRQSTLHRLAQQQRCITIAAAPSLCYRLAPKSHLHTHSFALKCRDTLDHDLFKKQLTESGYHHVTQVFQHGEYSIRGSIIDIFPMGSNTPYRIELFDNEVETIRSFDPDTQLSIKTMTEISLLPAHEYPLTNNSIELFRNNWRAKFQGDPTNCQLYNTVSNAQHANGIEYYLPLFFNETGSLFDHLSPQTIIIHVGNTKSAITSFNENIAERYEQLRYNHQRPILAPKEVFLTPDELLTACKKHQQITLLDNGVSAQQSHLQFSTTPINSITIKNTEKNPTKDLERFITNHTGSILFCAESTGRREIILELLANIGLHPKQYDNWSSYIKKPQPLSLCIAPLDEGFSVCDPELSIICEGDLWGEQVKQRRLRDQKASNSDNFIQSLVELKIDDPIVHINHGIGRYKGLQCIKTGKQEAEYVTLEYAGEDKIYVPITSLHLISRYSGKDSDAIKLQKLGNNQWEKIRKKSFEKIRDTAAELLDLYSKRAATPGFAYPKADNEFNKFRAAFPFEETPDQTASINAVLADMAKPYSMDRLVCGDVGFGKTEVAMQAAFFAAHNGKQVAILVPTTLLANQHAQNFNNRMADWPIHVAELSRMQSTKKQQEIIEGMANGTVDIVIGTHKLLQKNIKFKDLGLLIIDEEHRFGVRQKEAVKQLRSHVDILALTATPIPRTLNMALAGTRDLSIIATPPKKRLSIKTFIYNDNKEIIAEAINREVMRGGQVYFIHNDIATLTTVADRLTTIVPGLKIATAHGQMPERQLEQIMRDFYHQKYQLLLCTTIVESGIDVPSANTIIINRAERFGLAQIHQLRGRVGRSHHQAYAYLLVAEQKSLNRNAQKRLQAISESNQLGSGFNLANHDLEIRGAGELLGDEQSGHIEAIGFSLFMELLDEAVTALKSGKQPLLDMQKNNGVEIDLRINALLPDSYIHDINTRLTLYKRLSSCKTDNEIESLKIEIADRFGALPEPTKNLLKIAQLKLTVKHYGIAKIDLSSISGTIDFIEKPPIEPIKIIKLIQNKPKNYKMLSNQRIQLYYEKNCSRFEVIEQFIKEIS